MSAAIEASIEGVPAIGFSLLDYNWDAEFSHIRKYIKRYTNNNKIRKQRKKREVKEIPLTPDDK